MTAADLTLRIDTTGTAFGTAPTYTTVTSDLMWLGGIDLTWGRSDEQSEPSPRTCSFSLANPGGDWTPGSATAPAGWDVGSPVNVRVTVSAVVYDRFTGFVDSIEPTWVGGVHTWNVVRVTCTDVTARLARSNPLRSMVVQEMLADSPTYLYPLDEPSGSVSAGDISENQNAAATVRNSKYGPGVATFGTDVALSETTLGVEFSGGTVDGVNVPMTVLSLTDLLPASGAHTVECWIVAPIDPTPPARCDVLFQGEAGTFAWISLINGAPRYWLGSPSGGNATADGTGTLFDGRPHHLVGTMDSDGLTTKLYCDGALVDTDVAGTVMTFGSARYNTIGGTVSSNVAQLPFPGTIANVALYPTALSAARVLAHYQAGVGTLLEQSGARYARLAGYGNVSTAGLPTGQAQMGPQSTNGKTITDALNTVARTEGTVSFTTGAGALTFQDRQARYNATTGLTLAASEIQTPTVRRDRQGMANEITVSRNGGASQRVVDATAQTADGRFDGGSFEVACSTDDDAIQNAYWQILNRKEPVTRIPELSVDLLAATDAIRTACLAATVSTLISVTSMPAQSPTATLSLFAEGATEKIAANQWDIKFFTSPNPGWSVWTIETSRGSVDDIYVVAF